MDDGSFCTRGLMMRHAWRSSPRTSRTVACRLEYRRWPEDDQAKSLFNRSLRASLPARLPAAVVSKETDDCLMGVDICGPVNLPPPCFWRRCPVLHHDRMVSALIIQFVHRRIMCWTSTNFASVRGGQPKTDLFRRYRSAARGGF